MGGEEPVSPSFLFLLGVLGVLAVKSPEVQAMSEARISRRALLGWGAGATGLGALGALPLAWPRPGWSEPEQPDLSAKAPAAPVAIGRCEHYDRQEVTERLAKLFNDLGGIGSLVNGKTVTVKVNITGGPGGTCL